MKCSKAPEFRIAEPQSPLRVSSVEIARISTVSSVEVLSIEIILPNEEKRDGRNILLQTIFLS
jgi:hypothetical protein